MYLFVNALLNVVEVFLQTWTLQQTLCKYIIYKNPQQNFWTEEYLRRLNKKSMYDTNGISLSIKEKH